MKIAECKKEEHTNFFATHFLSLESQTFVIKCCLKERHESLCHTTTYLSALNCCYSSLYNTYSNSSNVLSSQSVFLFIVGIIFVNSLFDRSWGFTKFSRLGFYFYLDRKPLKFQKQLGIFWNRNLLLSYFDLFCFPEKSVHICIFS